MLDLKAMEENQKKFRLRDANWETHDYYLLETGQYKCTRCGAIEFQLGDKACQK